MSGLHGVDLHNALMVLRAEGWEIRGELARDPASDEWYPLWRAVQVAWGDAAKREGKLRVREPAGPIRDGGLRG